MTTAFEYVTPSMVILAVTVPAVVPAVPPEAEKAVTAFPLPSVVAEAGDTLPPAVVKATVTPLTLVVVDPVVAVTFAVTTLLPPPTAMVVGDAVTVMLKAVALRVIDHALLEPVARAARTVSDTVEEGLKPPPR
jgi:hypothetical protein